MTEEDKKLLNTFEGKLRHFMYLYEEQQKENASLRQLLAEKEVEIAIEDVQIGDVVIVKPGNNIPLDGKIIQGHGSINEAMITGESLPVDKTVGDQVIGSTNNLDGYMQVEVSHTSNDTTLSKIIRLVEEAGASKAPIAKLADKISGVFVPTVITIAITTTSLVRKNA